MHCVEHSTIAWDPLNRIVWMVSSVALVASLSCGDFLFGGGGIVEMHCECITLRNGIVMYHYNVNKKRVLFKDQCVYMISICVVWMFYLFPKNGNEEH